MTDTRRPSPYQVMPPLSAEEYDRLKQDIRASGVQVPVEYDQDGVVIEGHHRVQVCDELGIKDWPRMVRHYADEAARRTQALRLDMARRHLDQAARRALIEAELRERPEESNRTIAADLGVDHKTVMAERDRLVEIGEIPQSDTVRRKGGGSYPRKKPQKPRVASVSVPGINPASGNRDIAHRTIGTGEYEWYTPAEYIAPARQVLGGIDLDPASCEAANATVQAARFFTQEENGLAQPWAGRVFLNPPYAQPVIQHFADKMVAEWQSGRIRAAIMLTHNFTDTRWFHTLAHAAEATCFTRGRIRFVSPGGESAAPTNGQAFFCFGADVDLFAHVFVEVGLVYPKRMQAQADEARLKAAE
jgi:phage N-6-adenine-methyltransferase